MWWRPRTRPITGLVEGEVAAIAGHVKLSGRPLVAPFSEQRCAIYDARERVAIASWRGLLASSNFWVEDETGRALVRMPVSRARLKLIDVGFGRYEGCVGEGTHVLVRGRVSFHIVPDPWDPSEYREARAVPVLYGEGTIRLDVWGA